MRKNFLLTRYYNAKPIDLNNIFDELTEIYESKLKKYVRDTQKIIYKALKENKNVLGEGAQGALLDIDYGSYPYVTSSNTISGYFTCGAGIPFSKFENQIYSIFKAYCTRVGEGPFPTEIFGSEADTIRTIGHEYGSTTGRPRRCGWLDLVLAKYVIEINGIDKIILTKLDVLDKLEKIKLAVDYDIDDNYNDQNSTYNIDKNRIKFEEFDGWKSDTSKCREYKNLPSNAKKYIEKIEEYLEIPIHIITTGAERNEYLYK